MACLCVQAWHLAVQVWQSGMTNLQKMVSSVMQCVRSYLTTDELRKMGTALIQLVWAKFYGGDSDA